MLPCMNASYAVTWRNGTPLQANGRLELGPDAISLDGVVDGRPVREEIPYRDIRSVSIGRGPEDRIAGRQALVLGRKGHPPLRIAGIAEAWIVPELAEHLALLHVPRDSGRSRLVILVPIKDGVREEVQALLDRGAPFDPEVSGLVCHAVFLGDRELVFLFETDARESLAALFGRGELWEAAEAWEKVVAGPASVLDVVYEWDRWAA